MASPIVDNNKPIWAELATEAELGATRTYAAGVVILQPLADARQVGNRYFTLDTNTMWEIVEIPAGNRVAVASQGQAVSYASVPTLPPPRVRVLTHALSTGVTRSGSAANAYGTLVISVEDMPLQLLTQPQYSLQLELLRYVPKRRKLGGNGTGYKSMPAGFYHPSTWVGGVTPPAIAGTRGGSPSGVSVDRPTQWSLSGFTEQQQLTLTAAGVLLPFFELRSVEDYMGNNTTALLYYRGRKRTSVKGVLSYKTNPFAGVFKFRFAAFDQFSQRMIVGPHSDPIFARPQKWPTIVDPSNQFSQKRLINPVPVIDADTGVSCFEQLVISLGGRVSGRQF